MKLEELHIYQMAMVLNFCFYALGSLKETTTWLAKAKNRNLISIEKFTELSQLCESLSVKFNNYIRTTGK